MENEISTPTNKREVGFDIARGIAIVLMLVQHFYLLIISGFLNDPWWDLFFFFLGTVLAAPVFLFLMGVNAVKSRHNKPRELFTRGLYLLILGYLLSALRFYLPLILVQHFNLISNLESVIYKISLLDYLLQVDIFQVAGLSLMFIAFLKWCKVKLNSFLGAAILISLISPFLWQLNFSLPILNRLAAPFWGTDPYVVFPFFSWAFYPLVGFYFGNLLLASKNKKDFFEDCLLKMIPVGALGFIFSIYTILTTKASYPRHGFGGDLFFTAIIIAWLSVLSLNYRDLPAKTISNLTFLSKNTTLIYIIQWLLIAWLAIFINLNIFK